MSRTDRDGIHADYLDLDVSIDDYGYFNSKLFDKRHDFKFKVINFPCLTYSNIPTMPSYGIYLSQLLRVCRICTNINDFYEAMDKITKEFLNKGFSKGLLAKQFKKFIEFYEVEWCKFGVLPELPSSIK